MKKLMVSIFAGALLMGMAVAQDKQGKIQERKENQQERIAKGIENGSLTPAEAARLESKEGKLNKEIRRDRKDGGGLTNKEKAKINRQQNKLSKQIAKQKHDAQKQK